MQLNFEVWLSALDNFTRARYIEGCALMFPLLDRAAKSRRPKDGNRARMSKFITDEIENVIALGTGLDVEFDPRGKKIVLGDESLGEVIYRLRCNVLHEAELPMDIEFMRLPGQFQFSLTPASGNSSAKLSVPAQFCEALHLALLSCPEYSSIPAQFAGRRIRFGRHEILPSQCIGKVSVLRQQLIFGVSASG
jgi:hypothetical protein